MMKITFIYPAVGKKPGEHYIRTWKMEPLTVALLNALTPDDIEVEFFDDRIEMNIGCQVLAFDSFLSVVVDDQKVIFLFTQLLPNRSQQHGDKP